jgi:hypothetical protein
VGLFTPYRLMNMKETPQNPPFLPTDLDLIDHNQPKKDIKPTPTPTPNPQPRPNPLD